MRLKDGSKKLYESAVPESESPATKRGRAAGTVEPIGGRTGRRRKRRRRRRGTRRGGRWWETSTGYARKPRDGIQISLTRDRIICFSRISVSTVIAGRAVCVCARVCARADSSRRDHRVIYVQRGRARIIAMINYITRLLPRSPLLVYENNIVPPSL